MDGQERDETQTKLFCTIIFTLVNCGKKMKLNPRLCLRKKYEKNGIKIIMTKKIEKTHVLFINIRKHKNTVRAEKMQSHLLFSIKTYFSSDN